MSAAPSRSKYLWEQILQHVSLFFPAPALDIVRQDRVRLLPLAEALRVREPAIAIPTDVPAPAIPEDPYEVEFNGTRLTLWNRLPPPEGDGWSCVPGEAAPLWYRHTSGALVPAWNFFSNLCDLLTLREERESDARDEHGRFPAEASPRAAGGLLEVPAFNEAVAVLVAACAGLTRGTGPRLDLEGVEPELATVLSHDCDILAANDLITQATRLARVFLPLVRGRLPRPSNFWWITRSAIQPREFYYDNVLGTIDVERMLHFTSSFYMLNGSGGRFGARDKPAIIRQVADEIPAGWDVGMHYNHDTFLDAERFARQKQELEELLGRDVSSGRAHYLRFDPNRSWRFLAEQGIRYDETVGYSRRIGYRCGIAGIFRAFDADGDQKLDLWEVPTAVMDVALMRQYPEEALDRVKAMATHLSRLGGALSVLFHPGLFFNPEFPVYLGVYRRILGALREHGARSETARSLGQRAARAADILCER